MNNIYKKLSIILMFLSMIGCFSFEMNCVKAGANVGTLTPDSATGGGGGGGAAYSRQPLAFGYRISLVDSSGKHFAYTDNNGKKITTKSVDYWNKNQNYERTGCEGGCKDAISGYQALKGDGFNVSSSHLRCFYEKKYTKQEIVDSNSKFDCVTIENNKAKKYFDPSTTKKNSDIKIAGTNNMVFDENEGLDNCPDMQSYVQFDPPTGSGPCASHTGNNFAGNAAMSIAFKFFQGKDKNIDFTTLNQYLKNSGYNRESTAESNVKKAVSDKIYFQLEPVAAIQIQNTGKIYVGTITEIFKMWSKSNPRYYHTWYSGFSLYPDLSPIVYAKKNPGDKDSKASIELSSDGSGLLRILDNDDTTPENIYTKKSAFGVALYYLPDYIESGCTDDAVQTIYNKYYDNSGKIIKGKSTDKYDADISNICKSGSDDGCAHLKSDKLKEYGITSSTQVTCNKPSCSTTASNLLKNEGNSIGTIIVYLSNDVYDKIKGKYYSLTGKDESGKNITNFESTRLFGVKNGDDLCDPISCSSILDKIKNKGNYEEKLNKLYEKFGFDRLNAKFLEELYKEKEDDKSKSWLNNASCMPVPTCPVDVVTASCQDSGGSTFTLADTDLVADSKKSSEDKCLANGIAYNALNKRDDNNKIIDVERQRNATQTSYDSTYGTNAYCWESVTFNFPTTMDKSYDVISGEVLKWGIHNGDKDSNFGTMTVERKCHVTQNTKSIDVTWAKLETEGGRINPEITIYYKPAIPPDATADSTKVDQLTIKGETLDVELTKLNGEDITNSTKYSYSCYGSCKGKTITMKAEYDLNYGNSFKWYSSAPKSISDKTEIISYEGNEGTINDSNGSYGFIGYGLPTTLLTPTNISTTMEVYGKYNWNSVSNGSTSGQGTLHATVENIGTKNKNNGNYHFDKLVKFAINDDNDDNNDKIYYNCPYRVKNDLFDTESGDGDDFKTPKGIDVVFRTIDLINDEKEINKAFPGMSGSGRDMGANWAKVYTAENGATQVFNILSSSIYGEKRDPVYQITLDVGTIQNIRTYNRNARSTDNNKYDPYTSMPIYDSTESSEGKGYLGYICKRVGTVDESTYRYCASNFLTKLRDDGYLTGSCMENTGNTLDRANKYKENGCQQEWWNEE